MQRRERGPLRATARSPWIRRSIATATSSSGRSSNLLARLIAKGTGAKLNAFAREVLFDPLGIGPTEWESGRDGEALAASGLRMAPRDLARIGVAAPNGGRQVVPAEWLATAFAPAIALPDGRSYGLHWYLGAVPMRDGASGVRWERMVSAIGNGGQRLFLLLRLDLAVAVTAGNYDATDQWRPPLVVLRDVLLAHCHPDRR